MRSTHGMTTALVPIKHLSNGKSRLSSILSMAEREQLTASLLQIVLKVLCSSQRFDLICVVTNDKRIEKIARGFDINFIWEEKQCGENHAIEYATGVCAGLGANSLLVVHSDIPFITTQDIHIILDSCGDNKQVILCPSKEGTGTNAMFRIPPDIIPPMFGPNSLRLHAGEAESRGIQCKICHLERVALDIDNPEDLFKLTAFDETLRPKSFGRVWTP